MLELFDTLSSYWNKITEFFSVAFEKIVSAWETAQLATQFLPSGLVAVFITAIVIIIVLRIIGR